MQGEKLEELGCASSVLGSDITDVNLDNWRKAQNRASGLETVLLSEPAFDKDKKKLVDAAGALLKSLARCEKA